MEMFILLTITSVIIVSVLSILVALPFLFLKKIPNKLLMVLLSLSVGALMGGVFFHLLPKAVHDGYTDMIAYYILGGFLLFFLLEKAIHWHHDKKCKDGNCGHSHAYHLAPINLIGDGVHNFLDGLIIAGSYFAGLHIGIAATISVIMHEIPQELADFGVLLYSGFSRMKAVLFNFISASTAILGAIIGIMLAGNAVWFIHFILPFAAGNFLYIAASNLVPELHRECNKWDSLMHISAILLGIVIMVMIKVLMRAH